MRVIPPLEITPAMLTSSSATEPWAPSAYAGGTTYALGAIVSVAADYSIYESLAGSNTGNTPNLSPSWWRRLGATETAYSASTVYETGATVSSGSRLYESLTGSRADVTMTIAAPCVVTWVAHGRALNDPISFTTTGALPTGLVAGTVYYVLNPAANTFNVAATPGGAAITTTGTQSGTHTATSSLNLAKTPLINPTYWLDIGATNKWRALDIERNTQTVYGSPLAIVITPGERINSIAILGVEADTIQVAMTSGGPTVYDTTIDLSTREVWDGYDYFFEPFSTRANAILFDLPPYTNGILTVTFTRASGNAKVGAIVLGTFVDIGAAQYQAGSDVLNFSTVDRDPIFGDATLVPRRNVPKTIQEVWIDKEKVNKILALRTALNARPAVWSALDDDTDGYFEALLILGFYRRWSINVAYPAHAVQSLELEEV